MSGNNLLYWLSVSKSGSWQQFKSAVERLNVFSIHQMDESATHENRGNQTYNIIRINFERLGHAEFFSKSHAFDWTVCPPTLAGNRDEDDYSAVLAGARSLAQLQKISSVLPSKSLQIIKNLDTPDVYRFRNCTQIQLQRLAESVGLLFQPDATRTMLATLRPITASFIPLAELETPFGKDWLIESFCPESLRWLPEERTKTPSSGEMILRRFRFRNQRLHYITIGGRGCQVESTVGQFTLLHAYTKNVLRYLPERKSLLLPAQLRLPILIERALILQSGNIPTYDPSVRLQIFSNVSFDVAEMTARLLKQELS